MSSSSGSPAVVLSELLNLYEQFKRSRILIEQHIERITRTLTRISKKSAIQYLDDKLRDLKDRVDYLEKCETMTINGLYRGGQVSWRGACVTFSMRRGPEEAPVVQ